jgi:hypothetical protein
VEGEPETLQTTEARILTPEESAELGLPATEHGLLLMQDATGRRWTGVCDPDFLRMVAEAPEETRQDLTVSPDAIQQSREGWPEDW